MINIDKLRVFLRSTGSIDTTLANKVLMKCNIYLIQIKHLLKMLVPSEVYHRKMKIEMTAYIRATYPGDNS